MHNKNSRMDYYDPDKDYSTELERLKILKFRQHMQIFIRELKQPHWIMILAFSFAGLLIFLFGFGPAYRQESVPIKKEDNTQLVADFVGDVMFSRYVRQYGEKYDYDNFTRQISPILHSADTVFANWENPTLIRSEKEYEAAKNRTYTLYSTLNGLNAARNAGIDNFCMANNHMMDYGADAVRDMVDYFTEHNISFNGIGQNYKDARKYTLVDVNGLKIAYLAIDNLNEQENSDIDSPWVYTTVFQDYLELVYEAAEESDIMICYMHWGTEGMKNPDWYEQRNARQLIDAGADVVIGSHPHVLQPAELYRNGIIFYSLGNFIFDQNMTYNKDSVIVQMSVDDDNNCEYKLIPVRIKDGAPVVTDIGFYRNRINHSIAGNLEPEQYYYDTDGCLVISPDQKLERLKEADPETEVLPDSPPESNKGVIYAE